MDRPPYDTTHETPQAPVAFNAAVLRNPNGILKISEIIISIVVFICVATGYGWSLHASAGYINFTGAITLIVTALLLIFYLFNLMKHLHGPWVLIEFISRIVSVFLWFIAFIVAAANHQFAVGSAIATAVFSVVAVVLYSLELYYRFRVRREANGLIVAVIDVQTVVLPGGKPAAPGGMPADSHYNEPPYPADPAGVPRTGFAGDARAQQGYMP